MTTKQKRDPRSIEAMEEAFKTHFDSWTCQLSNADCDLEVMKNGEVIAIFDLRDYVKLAKLREKLMVVLDLENVLTK